MRKLRHLIKQNPLTIIRASNCFSPVRVPVRGKESNGPYFDNFA